MFFVTDSRTIVAIATGTGGGIGIVRLSGGAAFQIADQLFLGSRPVAEMRGYTGQLGRVHDGRGDLDQAILFAFHAPYSYTGEDVCEISCHGGAYILERVVQAAVALGAFPAAPGEFTRRALLNGKMTLTEAESVAALIAGESRQAVRAALAAYDGQLYRRINSISTTLLEVGAHLAAWVDFPEEDVETLLQEDLADVLADAHTQLRELAEGYESGRMLREGISTAIVGSPNVGKSTLMNLLAGQEKSIVTPIPGTTRDVVEERIRLGELVLNLCDTAGIRATQDPVEQLGVARSMQRLEQCDLVLAIFDGARPLDSDDLELLRRLEGRMAIGVVNKCDLPRQADLAAIRQNTRAVVELSAKEGQGLEQLAEEIARQAGLECLDGTSGLLQNRRQLACVVTACAALEEGLAALEAGQTLDALSLHLEEAADALLSLTGQKASDEMIDRVFETFCVGK